MSNLFDEAKEKAGEVADKAKDILSDNAAKVESGIDKAAELSTIKLVTSTATKLTQLSTKLRALLTSWSPKTMPPLNNSLILERCLWRSEQSATHCGVGRCFGLQFLLDTVQRRRVPAGRCNRCSADFRKRYQY